MNGRTETRTAHTPGPWQVGKHCDEVLANGYIIATTHWDYFKGEPRLDAEANARLIAAAPDMLAALRHFADAYTPRDDCYDPGYDLALRHARRAIAKATGSPAALNSPARRAAAAAE